MIVPVQWHPVNGSSGSGEALKRRMVPDLER